MDSHGTSSYTDARRETPALSARRESVRRLAEHTSLLGFLLYAVFAPHSIAGAQIALGLTGLGWLLRTIATGNVNLRRTPQDLPICLFLAWTILSAFLSEEPRISLAKLQSVFVVHLFYMTRAVLTRRTALMVVALMITSGVAGVVWSVADIARGRGAIVEEMTVDSPFQGTSLRVGDAVWRIGTRRVSNIREIDDAIRSAPTGVPLAVSFIRQGEHGEWPTLLITDEMKARPSPSGLKGRWPTHRFRASGWTRHYETFSETLQILAQLALGLALAQLHQRRDRWRAWASLFASAVLAMGILLTAMRTVLVALAIGAGVISWRAARKKERLIICAAIIALLVAGALAVQRTRVTGALAFEDASTRLRLDVAGVALSRLMIHPFFGHGMDAVKKHWSEWGFPGTDVIHMHSTPLQLAFDRGLPALLFWLWIMASFWRTAARAESSARADAADTNRHGLLLGATGALAGFFASSLVNYNFGDGEVALVFWWLMGIVVISNQNSEHRTQNERQ